MKLLYIGLSFIAVVVGCRQHPPQYLIDRTFDLGTNATVNISQTLPVRGYFEFSFELLRSPTNITKPAKWPLEIDVAIHFLVKTNGGVAMDSNASKLKLSSVSKSGDHAWYYPSCGGFLVTTHDVVLDCKIEDRSSNADYPAIVFLSNIVAK